MYIFLTCLYVCKAPLKTVTESVNSAVYRNALRRACCQLAVKHNISDIKTDDYRRAFYPFSVLNHSPDSDFGSRACGARNSDDRQSFSADINELLQKLRNFSLFYFCAGSNNLAGIKDRPSSESYDAIGTAVESSSSALVYYINFRLG